ncbi:hypothetical protein MKZ38_007115 [Zalerion maritima]|uniref:Acetyl-CoA synthetase-like protein n=1 Tax=Zalerion maritima TaxID=339359 RepID=A0AAD5RI57_9PEZI|nr:hypothetical protein MKZ38_007115 [Zalerion maritima]
MPHKSPYDPVTIPDVDLWDALFEREDLTYSKDKKLFIDPLNPSEGSNHYTFDTLKATAKAFGRGLRRHWGWRKGDVLMFYLPNHLDTPAATWGTHWAGGVCCPANPLYTVEELVKQMRDAGVSGVVTVDMEGMPFLGNVLKAAEIVGLDKERVVTLGYGRGKDGEKESSKENEEGVKCWRDLFVEAKTGEVEKREKLDPKTDLCFLCYSSGTTGLPKGVRLTHRNIVANILQVNAVETPYLFPNGHGGGDRQLAVLPFFHIFGLVVVLHITVFIGLQSIVLPRFDLELACKIIQDHRITYMYVPPPIILAFGKHPIVDKYDVSSIRVLTSGAAPLTQDLVEGVWNRLKIPVKQGYGLSETSPVCQLQTLDEWAKKVGSVGRLVPGCDAVLVDTETGKEVAGRGEDGTGELWVRGPNVFGGYHRREELNKEVFGQLEGEEEGTGGERWFRTGDIAYVDDKGFWYITDRLKELIKYKGFQVPPAELEGLLLGHHSVADSCVIGVYDHEQATELPRAYVVPVGGIKNGTEELARDVGGWVAKKVTPHKRLRGGVRFVEEVPKTASGKILRRVLKDVVRKEEEMAGRKELKISTWSTCLHLDVAIPRLPFHTLPPAPPPASSETPSALLNLTALHYREPPPDSRFVPWAPGQSELEARMKRPTAPDVVAAEQQHRRKVDENFSRSTATSLAPRKTTHPRETEDGTAWIRRRNSERDDGRGEMLFQALARMLKDLGGAEKIELQMGIIIGRGSDCGGSSSGSGSGGGGGSLGIEGLSIYDNSRLCSIPTDEIAAMLPHLESKRFFAATEQRTMVALRQFSISVGTPVFPVRSRADAKAGGDEEQESHLFYEAFHDIISCSRPIPAAGDPAIDANAELDELARFSRLMLPYLESLSIHLLQVYEPEKDPATHEMPYRPLLERIFSKEERTESLSVRESFDFPNMKSLSLRSPPMTKERMSHILASCPRIEEIRLGDVFLAESAEVRSAWIAAYKHWERQGAFWWEVSRQYPAGQVLWDDALRAVNDPSVFPSSMKSLWISNLWMLATAITWDRVDGGGAEHVVTCTKRYRPRSTMEWHATDLSKTTRGVTGWMRQKEGGGGLGCWLRSDWSGTDEAFEEEKWVDDGGVKSASSRFSCVNWNARELLHRRDEEKENGGVFVFAAYLRRIKNQHHQATDEVLTRSAFSSRRKGFSQAEECKNEKN